MELVVLDTNVFIYLLTEELSSSMEINGKNLYEDYSFIMPAAVKAELGMLPFLRGWGPKKKEILDDFFNNCFVVHTNDAITQAYIEMKAYATRKLERKPPGGKSYTMSMNDLWIAATARDGGFPLVTADNDFDPLNGEYLTVYKINPEEL